MAKESVTNQDMKKIERGPSYHMPESSGGFAVEESKVNSAQKSSNPIAHHKSGHDKLHRNNHYSEIFNDENSRIDLKDKSEKKNKNSEFERRNTSHTKITLQTSDCYGPGVGTTVAPGNNPLVLQTQKA